MKFRVCLSADLQRMHKVRFALSSRRTGREVGWVNRYLDREYVRRLADKTLRIYAHNLLHFVRWWASVHHTGDVVGRRPYRINAAGLYPIPVRSTTSAFRFHHQRTASPSPIAPCVTSFPMLPARSPAAFIKPSCGAGRWASADRGWR